jgi:hypothetical protein
MQIKPTQHVSAEYLRALRGPDWEGWRMDRHEYDAMMREDRHRELIAGAIILLILAGTYIGLLWS